MSHYVLITGGAGFLGSHLADHLLAEGHRVRALDNLCAQVHGEAQARPSYLDARVELQVGEVEDPTAVVRALRGVDVVFHFAARVGVGQSMYQIRDYARTNDVGTAVLLEALTEHRLHRLVVASSMSIYGEGLYRSEQGQVLESVERDPELIRQGRWDPPGPDGTILTPVPTPEWKRPALASIYALQKYAQERMCLIAGRAYGIPAVALRFWNAYGPRQALSNPYTGVLAIFASRLLNGKPPLIFEDGEQQRDFISVHDVCRACLLAMEFPAAIGQAINVGSGAVSTVTAVARQLAQTLGSDIAPEITRRHRVGDVRHCVPDITLAQRTLGYQPQVALGDGLADLVAWLRTQQAVDRVAEMNQQLASRGLAI